MYGLRLQNSLMRASVHVYLRGSPSHQGNGGSGRTRETFLLKIHHGRRNLKDSLRFFLWLDIAKKAGLGKTITWTTRIKLILNSRPLKPGNGGEFKSPVGRDSGITLVITSLLLHLLLSSSKYGAGGEGKSWEQGLILVSGILIFKVTLPLASLRCWVQITFAWKVWLAFC